MMAGIESNCCSGEVQYRQYVQHIPLLAIALRQRFQRWTQIVKWRPFNFPNWTDTAFNFFFYSYTMLCTSIDFHQRSEMSSLLIFEARLPIGSVDNIVARDISRIVLFVVAIFYIFKSMPWTPSNQRLTGIKIASWLCFSATWSKSCNPCPWSKLLNTWSICIIAPAVTITNGLRSEVMKLEIVSHRNISPVIYSSFFSLWFDVFQSIIWTPTSQHLTDIRIRASVRNGCSRSLFGLKRW